MLLGGRVGATAGLMTSSSEASLRQSFVLVPCFHMLFPLTCQDRDLLGWAAHFKIPTDLVQALSDESLDISTFGMCATNVGEVDAALAELLPARAFSLQEHASIRLLWQLCFALAAKPTPASALPTVTSDPASTASGTQDPASSWSSSKEASTTLVVTLLCRRSS